MPGTYYLCQKCGQMYYPDERHTCYYVNPKCLEMMEKWAAKIKKIVVDEDEVRPDVEVK